MKKSKARKQYDAGEKIRLAGDPVDCYFFCEYGSVTFSKTSHLGKRQIIGFAFQGDYFGLTGLPYFPSDLHANTTTIIQEINLDHFRHLIDSAPEFRQLLFKQLQSYSDGFTELIFSLGAKDAIGKIASFFIYLLMRKHGYGLKEKVIDIQLTRHEIGDFLGLNSATVSRVITKFKKLKLVDFSVDGQIQIKDVQRLSEYADLKMQMDQLGYLDKTPLKSETSKTR